MPRTVDRLAPGVSLDDDGGGDVEWDVSNHPVAGRNRSGMKPRRRQRVVIAAALMLMGIMLAAVLTARFVTDRNRSTAVTRFKNPALIERHRHIPKTSAPAPDVPPNPPEPTSEEISPSESIAAFARVFDQAKALGQRSRWRESEEVFYNKPPKDWTPEDWVRAKAALDDIQDLVHEIRRLADRGGPAYELDYSKGFSMELPHLAQLRNLARILRVDALVQGRKGDYGEVVEDIVAGMKLSANLKDEPILISQLVRFAMNGIAYDAATEALPTEGLSPDLVHRLIDYAGRMDYRGAFADTFSSEAYFGVDAFERVRDGNLNAARVMPTTGLESLGLRLYGSVLARPWLNMDEEAYATRWSASRRHRA
jgi:hypothetical protein